MIYGYVRVSTKTQNLERQIENIKTAYADAIIYKEKYTGTTVDRPEWNKLHKRVKRGDVIVFDSVSRMSRNAKDGFNLYQELFKNGVELIFIKEPHISTAVYKKALEAKLDGVGNEIADIYIEATNKVLQLLQRQQIEIAFEQAEKEVTDKRQNIKEGIRQRQIKNKEIEAGVRTGDLKQIGLRRGTKLITKKSVTGKEEIKRLSKDFDGSLNDIDCMKTTNLSRNTFYKYKRELKEELAESY